MGSRMAAVVSEFQGAECSTITHVDHTYTGLQLWVGTTWTQSSFITHSYSCVPQRHKNDTYTHRAHRASCGLLPYTTVLVVCKLHVVNKEKGVQVLVYKVKVHAGVVA